MNIPSKLKETFLESLFVLKTEMVFPCRTYDDRATMEIYEVCCEMYDCEIYDYEMYKCEINVYEIYVYEIRDNLDIGIIYIYK